MIRETTARPRGRITAALGVLLAFALALIVASPAAAAGDPLSGGTTTLNLKLPKKVKVGKISPATKSGKKTIKLPIKDGNIDPTNCSGNETLNGGMKFKYKGNKAKVKGLKVSLNQTGQLKGKIGKKKKTIATLSGGTCGRNGFGAKLTGAKMKLTKGAKTTLNKALSGNKKKPFKKSGFGGLSTQTVPETVHITGGTTDLTPNVALLTKLGAHGIDPTMGGVLPIQGATFTGGAFHFPVTGGTSNLTGTNGLVHTSGGVQVKKTNAPPFPPNDAVKCAAAHPTGTVVTLTNLSDDETTQGLLADAEFPAPAGTSGNMVFPQAPFGSLSGTSASSDLNARTITINATVTAQAAAALLLSQVYGSSTETVTGTTNPCGFPSSTDFVAGDPIGTIVLTLQAQ